ncbi:Peptidoglycan/LPS O-acetylase OafA/YrhL, contains acyltransferase and SGNH-hydrolase domains [Pedococcus dokdonensis]|uniref:Peptidoglycan/LPS O-acetylase OafA/YrhL, contains acyltransferase and SGNH-hydrolase domains n=1 Tax=Pedococcus dokdonensis TaxID=443156 RepID=A0A1H0PB85_9MICO|nr:acyltransferase [Pedococcus dokdonensis]SDP01866.1 Peptidoglycan/LPS O-acetylase OafA/YrhL, contains acyltransferase and SGNH-hydrolase domains [Pedococcus dokdonensis]
MSAPSDNPPSVSSQLPRMAGLDGLRAVAAGLVVLTHVGFLTGAVSFGVIGRLLGRGDLGVSIFFALSGFLLYAAMGREWDRTGHVDVPAYYLRRAVRVLPAFWVGLLVVGLAVRPDARVWVTNATLTQIYVPDALLDGYTQTWSLATEVSFYLVLPFVFLVLRRRTSDATVALQLLGATWLLGLVAAVASGVVEIGGDTLAGRWLPAHWPEFALGMALAVVRDAPTLRSHRVLRDLAAYPGTCLAGAGGAYLLATTTVAGPLTLGPVAGVQLAGKGILGSVVTAGLMVPLLFGPGRDVYSRALSCAPARYLGRISYGVFLWHLPVFEAVYALTGIDYFTGGAVALLAVGVPVTLGLAALSERLVERPLMDRVHARTGPTR